MSIEALIQDNTDALRALADLLQPTLAALLTKAPAVNQEKEVKEVVQEAIEEPKPETKKVTRKKAAKPEPEPEVEEVDPLADFEAEEEPKVEEVKSILPPGKRDQAYYDAHVKPILTELAQIDLPKLLSIVRDQYGVKKADMLPPDQWDALAAQVQALVDESNEAF